MYFSRSKQIFINFLCLISIGISLSNFLNDSVYDKLPEKLKNRVNLGLELQGGSYLQLSVDLNEANKDEMSGIQSDLRKKLKKSKVKFNDLRISVDKIIVDLKSPEQKNLLKQSIQAYDPQLLVHEKDNNIFEIFYDQNVRKKKDDRIIDQCIEVIRHRVDETGTKEPHIYRQGEDRIILQLPGISNPEEVKALIGQTARLTMRLVKGYLNQDTKVDSIPVEYDILPSKDNEADRYIVEKEVLLTGDVLESTKVTQREGQPAVAFSMNKIGAQKFGEITLQNVGKQLAIILDNVIISAPKISMHIPTGEGNISGSMSLKDASQLKLILSSGALPAPLKIIEERVVGPTLGNDSIQDGKRAVLVSFIMVTIFMFLCYNLFGIFACVSLVFNIVFLLAALSILNATLTLPGIAGIALTIGMAVDANVLIYERIKEELRDGIKPIKAIALGFERAMTTIIDANITTLIAAAVLYQFGSGPVRGFAVTLAVGIVISMFTALTLTNYQIFLWSRKQNKLENLRI